MRRIVVVLVLAVVGAGFAGRLVGADGLRVDGASISASSLRAELGASGRSASFSCYLASLLNVNTASTASVFSAAGVASWSKIQIDGLAIESYVQRHYAWRATSAQLSEARTEYVTDLQNAASVAGTACPLTSSQALASMPAWFINDQLTANAASLELVRHVPGIIPLDLSQVEKFFAQHPASYVTICITVAIVPQAYQSAFVYDQQHGLSLSALARKYSVDPSKSKGGVYGCFAPNNVNYPTVRDYTYGTPTGQYPATPRTEQNSSGVFDVYVAATKRTASSLTAAASLVVSDIRSRNATLASIAQGAILQAANVAIDPAFAKWSIANLNTVALTQPSAALTPNSGAGLGF